MFNLDCSAVGAAWVCAVMKLIGNIGTPHRYEHLLHRQLGKFIHKVKNFVNNPRNV